MKLDVDKILRFSPGLPPKKYLTKLKFKHNGKKGWHESGDKNLKRRYNFIKALYPKYREKDRKLIRFLLSQEIKYAQKLGDHSFGLNLTSFMLFTIMSVKDVKKLFDAKFNTCYDARFGLDIELVFGIDKDLTKQYYQKKPDRKREIVEVITEYENRPFKTRQEYIKFYIERQIQGFLEETY